MIVGIVGMAVGRSGLSGESGSSSRIDVAPARPGGTAGRRR